MGHDDIRLVVLQPARKPRRRLLLRWTPQADGGAFLGGNPGGQGRARKGSSPRAKDSGKKGAPNMTGSQSNNPWCGCPCRNPQTQAQENMTKPKSAPQWVAGVHTMLYRANALPPNNIKIERLPVPRGWGVTFISIRVHGLWLELCVRVSPPSCPSP